MLLELRLRNYRCFRDHTIPFRECTIVVGRNNAGKSTVVEALRLVSIVLGRHLTLGLKEPSWGNLPRAEFGVEPSVKNLEVNSDTLFHNYGEPPAIIDAKFANGNGLTVYVGSQRIHGVLKDSRGRPARSRKAAANLGLPSVAILPQVAPLSRKEVILSPDYVRASMSSSLAPMHFRNQLALFPESFAEFQGVVEETWSGLQVQQIEGLNGMPGDPLALPIRNEDFVADVALMGHGVQMWLQTVWFLVRSRGSATAILDEPDVYMHPDLQRRLIRLIRRLFPQVIVATHSVEILAEVEPSEILVIDRRRRNSRFLSTLPGVQEIVDQIGSIHNVQLARLGQSKRLLFLEGDDDVKLLGTLYSTLFGDLSLSFTDIPSVPVGGWGGFSYACGSARLLSSQAAERIVPYCILDSDYHTEAERRDRYAEAQRVGLELHIWSRKELENYLIVPAAIARVIEGRRTSGEDAIAIEEVTEKLESIFEQLRTQVFDAFANDLLAADRARGLRTANQMARQIVDGAWSTQEGRIAIVPGKEVLARVSEYAQQRTGKGLTAASIARAIRSEEMGDELVTILEAIHRGAPFENRASL